MDNRQHDAAPEAARDHRDIARRLDLFHMQDHAPGMAFWHPAGFTLYRLLEDAARRVLRAQGYAEVRTPQILRRPVWERSGHWRHFADGMWRVADEAAPAAIKPVNCPGHVLIVAHRPPSYRELPLRLAEMGVVHRDEPGGTLHGLLRMQQFTQDDGHVFCVDEAQAEDEVLRFCQHLPRFYAAFGFAPPSLALSLRPADRAGDDAQWDRAEAALRRALDRLGQPYVIQEGAGAFYGPKVEFALQDSQGRAWQCGTIQFDLVMPGRFDLHFIGADGGRHAPVMLHRALYGSLERFMAMLLEHHGARLPAWLAPVQAVVLPIGDEALALAQQTADALRAADLRVACDAEDSLSRRLVRAHERGIPHQLIIGAREVARQAVMLRAGDDQKEISLAALPGQLAERCGLPDVC